MKQRLAGRRYIFHYYLLTRRCGSTFILLRTASFVFFGNALFIPYLGGSVIVSLGQGGIDMRVRGPFNRITGIERKQKDVVAQFFIEFQPGGLSRLIFPNCEELLNRKPSLEELDTGLYRSLGHIMEQRFPAGKDDIANLDQFFLTLLDERREYYANGRSILRALQGSKPDSTMQALSSDVHYSQRHINRYLNAYAGVSGKEYLRLKRLSKAAGLLKEGGGTIEQIANRLCYYDAAHFVHDFSQLSGISPLLFRENKSGFYNETRKLF
jgi:AraC-like DNA-binding protein